MKSKGRSMLPGQGGKPVKHIELDDGNIRKRVIGVAVLLVIALVAFGIGIYFFLHTTDGWTTIEISSASEESVSCDLIFRYELGAGDMSATAENKEISTLYTEACVNAYKIFNSDNMFDGVNNVCYINAHPNETIEIPSTLYKAFELLDRYNNRQLFAAPMYTDYSNLFYSDDDMIARQYDPYFSHETAEYMRLVSVYTNNAEHVSIALLGNNTVRLDVSNAYMLFAEENGITSYIDFYWMRNAFVVDYIADVMNIAGFTRGNITSYDGFMRNLDNRTIAYGYNLFDLYDNIIYPAAQFNYSGSMSIVYLREYSITSLDEYYYTYADGTMRTAYVDVASGLCKSSVDSLIAYSDSKGAAETLLCVTDAYISDSFNASTIKNVDYIRFDGTSIIRSNKNASISELLDDSEIQYILAE